MANRTYKDKQKRFAPKLKIKKGDRVVVIAGANRNLTLPREVLEVFPTENRALVEGVNLRKKHQRATETQEGGIIEKAASIHISNLMLLTEDDQPTRVGRRKDDNGNLVRFAKRDGNTIK